MTAEIPLQCGQRMRALESESIRAHQSSRAMGREDRMCPGTESGYERRDDTYKKDAHG